VNARAALPELVERFHRDPEGPVRVCAERVLWAVAPADARREGGWRTISSDKWGFTADFPAQREESDVTRDSPWGPAVARSFNAPHQADRCGVVVTDYPAAFAELATEEKRLDAISGSAAMPLFGGRVTQSRDIKLAGLKGRAVTIESDTGTIRSRVYVHGRRTYVILVVYKPEYLVAPAADHFLDSLQIMSTPVP
jgi:hypothetical protein